MGTCRHYTRFTSAELDRAVHDNGWADEYLFELWRAEVLAPKQAPQDARVLDIDEGWVEIDVVLAEHGVPIAAHTGSHILYPNPRDPEHWFERDDEGRLYGVPTYLTPQEVAAVAQILVPLDFAGMYTSVDPVLAAQRTGFSVAEWIGIDDGSATSVPG